MAEGYVTGIALDKDNQIIGYKFVSLGKMTDFIKKGDDPTTAYEKACGQYGRVADAVKIIDPRTDEEESGRTGQVGIRLKKFVYYIKKEFSEKMSPKCVSGYLQQKILSFYVQGSIPRGAFACFLPKSRDIQVKMPY